MSIIISKRSFLFGAAATLITAPAIVASAHLMPVKVIERILPPPQLMGVLYGASSLDGPWLMIGPASQGGYLGVAYPAGSLAVCHHDACGYPFLKRDEAWIRT
jgi:hypothetical protein